MLTAARQAVPFKNKSFFAAVALGLLESGAKRMIKFDRFPER
jgi:hypothetical protein